MALCNLSNILTFYVSLFSHFSEQVIDRILW